VKSVPTEYGCQDGNLKLLKVAGHMRVPDQACPTYGPASRAPDGADTAFRLISKLWPRRSWVDSITNTVWKDVRLDFPEEYCS
jgi:hypothetical protein